MKMTHNLNVLIVDDEKMIREALTVFLTKMGFCTYEAENGNEALALFEKVPVDFIILDLMLPGISGEDVCREIRKTSQVPIIMLTAKTMEENIITGLSLGADDYVIKPFSIKQLYARMEAVLRRTSGHAAKTFEGNSVIKPLDIDFTGCEVRKNGIPVNLTKSEWLIISSMASHPGKIFTRDELISIVFGDEHDSFDRIIDTHIKNLRKKLEEDSRVPVYIKTVHGIGYKFTGEI